MKRKTAQEILAESFREIAEKKPVDKIAVQDVTETAGIPRPRFTGHSRTNMI